MKQVSKETFLEKAKSKHGDKYDYSLIDDIFTTENKLSNQTLHKSKIILDKGYNLISIWEKDWKNFVNAIIKIQKLWKFRKVNLHQK